MSGSLDLLRQKEISNHAKDIGHITSREYLHVGKSQFSPAEE
jgi:hypothetical protein